MNDLSLPTSGLSVGNCNFYFEDLMCHLEKKRKDGNQEIAHLIRPRERMYIPVPLILRFTCLKKTDSFVWYQPGPTTSYTIRIYLSCFALGIGSHIFFYILYFFSKIKEVPSFWAVFKVWRRIAYCIRRGITSACAYDMASCKVYISNLTWSWVLRSLFFNFFLTEGKRDLNLLWFRYFFRPYFLIWAWSLVRMISSLPSAFPDQPLSPPPPGVKSNFTHPDSRAYQVYISAGLCLALICVFVSLRFYAKVAIMKNLRWDDCGSHFLWLFRPSAAYEPLWFLRR